VLCRCNGKFTYNLFVIHLSSAISILRDSEPGSFVIRDCQSFPGAFGLAVKVAVPPAHVLQGLQGDMSKLKIHSNLVLRGFPGNKVETHPLRQGWVSLATESEFVIRRVELYDQVKTRLSESQAEAEAQSQSVGTCIVIGLFFRFF